MAYLSASIPASGQYFGYAPSFVNRAVVIPLTVTGNDVIQFDDNVSTAVPLYSGVVFEYNSPTTFLNFAIQGTAGDTFLIWFDKTSNGSGPRYVVTTGLSVNVDNSPLNTNVTNSTLNTNVTNSSLNTNVTNSVINENIQSQTLTLDQVENLYSGSFVFYSPSVNMSAANSYVALKITLVPNDVIQINTFTIVAQASVNNVASNYYANSSYQLPCEVEWHDLQASVVSLPANWSYLQRVGSWLTTCVNNTTSPTALQIYAGVPTNFICNTQTWRGKIYIANTTGSNQTFYLGLQHSGNAGEVNSTNTYILALDYEGLISSNSSIQGISSSGSGGSGGGGGSRHNVF